jgi:hypothetical protein
MVARLGGSAMSDVTERAARAAQERRNRRPSKRRNSAETRQQVVRAATHPTPPDTN